MREVSRPGPSARRQASDDLAALLAGESGLHEARLLQLLRILEERGAGLVGEAPAEEKPRAEPHRIGIWEPKGDSDELVFERAAVDSATDLLWDVRPRIAAAKESGRRRVCLIGESAATG